MTRNRSTILIVITRGSEGISPETAVAGVPLLRRVVMGARRAGFHDIQVVDSGQPGLARLLEGTGAVLLSPGGLANQSRSARVLVLASDLLSRPLLLQRLSEMPLRAGTMHVPASGIAAVETVDAQGFLSSLGRTNDAASVFSRLEGAYQKTGALTDGAGWIRVSKREDLPTAEQWLMRGLIKDTEGFMSRHVERKISLAITRRLVSTGITPNQMTAVSVAIGLLGAPLFLSSAPSYELGGALLFLLHSILDGCDGEIARLKYLESRRGAILDFWGDNLVHSAVFVCIGLGWRKAVKATFPLILAFFAVVGTLLSAGFVYRRSLRVNTSEASLITSVAPSETPSRLSAFADGLLRRDFIYLVVVLSAWGKAHWFLALAGVGSPVFFFILLWISHKGRAHA
ncbi:MAG: CDP-alcohol phosphatidyltransferase family protein [Candidatus Methylomirabilis oxyfera]|nr:CDP-alcohol phosphatidyltransferase family protein [Candidatus Methylomirabilis oxyfera]